MHHITILFFGSFQHHSVQVLEALHKHFRVTGVITTPPKPHGRHMSLRPTEVEVFARSHNLPVFTPTTLESIPENISRPDFLVVSGYSKLIPQNWLSFPKIMAINMHASYLPYYRGAFPAEWAMLFEETETGITLIKMSAQFDKGEIVEQQKIPILPTDTKETIYTRLYTEEANMLIRVLSNITNGNFSLKPQQAGKYFYARKITREDGFFPWELIQKAMHGDPMDTPTMQQWNTVPLLKEWSAMLKKNPEELPLLIERAVRALSGWPGVWTRINITQQEQATRDQQQEKILKILSAHLQPTMHNLQLDLVQLEGKKPVSFTVFEKAYRSNKNNDDNI